MNKYSENCSWQESFKENLENKLWYNNNEDSENIFVLWEYMCYYITKGTSVLTEGNCYQLFILIFYK